MAGVIKTVLYVVFVAAVYCQEHDVPVMMYIKRYRYLADWKLAAWANRQAISSYHSYAEEAEYTRG